MAEITVTFVHQVESGLSSNKYCLTRVLLLEGAKRETPGIPITTRALSHAIAYNVGGAPDSLLAQIWRGWMLNMMSFEWYS